MNSLWVNIGDRFEIADFENTLESLYLYGLFGAIPLLRPPLHKETHWRKIKYVVEDKRELAKRLREVADKLEKGESDEESKKAFRGAIR